MAFLVIVINSSNDSIANLNQKVQDPTKAREAIVKLSNYLYALESGAVAGTVQVTSRDTDPSVATSGAGSQQVTYTKS